MSQSRNTVVTLAAALTVAAGVAYAQPQPGYGPGYGPGPGMMGGPGPGYGMGPGMMGGGSGYGPRGGYGPGPYGGGTGPGMGYGADRMLDALNLTDAQRADVNKIRDDVRRKNWDLLGKMQDEQAKLRDLYAAEKLDRPAISAAYKRLGDLRQQRIDNMLEAHEKMEVILSPEQRKQLRRWGPGWAQ